MTKDESLELALEALTYIYTETTADEDELIDQAITAIKEALAQTQDPVAFASHGVINWIADKQFQHEADLYTTPPQRKPLTDEEMKKIWYAMQNIMGWYSFEEVARAIEAAHGIKG